MNTQLVDQIRSILEKNSNGVGFALIQVKAGSAENARECLAVLQAVMHNGYWFLPEHAPEIPTAPDKRSNKEKVRDLLLAGGAMGVNKEQIISAGINEGSLYQVIFDVRKNYFGVERTTRHGTAGDETVYIAKEFIPDVTPPTQSLTIREKGKIESAFHQAQQGNLLPNQRELITKLSSHVQVAVIKKRMLRLNRGDIGDLLCTIFGYPAIEWHDDSEHMAILVDTLEGESNA